MLKTYRIIPLVFILFLFGFTTSSGSVIFEKESLQFVACQQIKPSGDFQLMKQKKNCFRDVARLSQDQSGDSMQPVVPTDPSGGVGDQIRAMIPELRKMCQSMITEVKNLEKKHIHDSTIEYDFVDEYTWCVDHM